MGLCREDAVKRWPWITVLLAAVAALNPLGLDIIQTAFFSGEALARNIWQPIVLCAAAIFAVLIGLEWWIRRRLLVRHAA
jgi:hypothetical protein